MENHIFDFIEQYMLLTEEEKRAIVDLDIIRSFKKGTVLVKEGDLIKSGFLVIKGCLRSYYIVNGEEKNTGFYTETEPIVLVSSDEDSGAVHFVSCLEDSIVTVGDPDMEKETLEKFPRFQKLCMIIAEQLLENNIASYADFKHFTPEQRYLSLLKTRPDLLQRVPQHQLASFLGVTPPSLSRIRKRLAQNGTV
jgi:CRP-like cAMP-binding protein